MARFASHCSTMRNKFKTFMQVPVLHVDFEFSVCTTGMFEETHASLQPGVIRYLRKHTRQLF